MVGPVPKIRGFLQSKSRPLFLPASHQLEAKSDGFGATSWRESQILAHPPTVNGCRSLVLRPEAESDWLSGRGEAITSGGAAEGEMGPGQAVVRFRLLLLLLK